MKPRDYLYHFYWLLLVVQATFCFEVVRNLLPVSDVEIRDFLTEEEDVKFQEKGKVIGWGYSVKRDEIPTREETLNRRSVQADCFDVSDEDGIMTYKVKEGEACRHSVNAVLEEKGGGQTLEALTAEYFNGETYAVTSFQEIGDKLVSLNAESPVPVILFDKLALQTSSTIQVELGEWDGADDLSFSKVAITVTGKSHIKMKERTLPYDIETEIAKPPGSDVYEITKFDFTGETIRWIELVDSAQDFAEKYFKFDRVDIVSKVGEMLKGFTGFGAFNADNDFQLGIVAEGEAIQQIGGAKKLTILFGQTHTDPDTKATVFLEFDEETQLIDGITNFIGDSAGIDTSFMMNKVSSTKWCILAVTGTTSYLEPIRNRLQDCLGTSKEELNAGVHFFVELDFQAVLLECGNTEEEIGDITATVGIYATINSKGVSINLPNGVAIPMQALLKCGGALIKRIPEFLGSSMVTLTEVDMNYEERLLKLGVDVELSEKYKRIPGTSIKINKFSLLADRQEDADGGGKYWDVSASGNVEVGAATFDLSVEKSGKAYSLKLSVDDFTLSDMLSVFNYGGDSGDVDREVFQTLGIKDFSLEWSFGDGPTRVDVRGRPLLFGYDNMYFNAFISAGNEGSIEEERRRKHIPKRKKQKQKQKQFQQGVKQQNQSQQQQQQLASQQQQQQQQQQAQTQLKQQGENQLNETQDQKTQNKQQEQQLQQQQQYQQQYQQPPTSQQNQQQQEPGGNQLNQTQDQKQLNKQKPEQQQQQQQQYQQPNNQQQYQQPPPTSQQNQQLQQQEENQLNKTKDQKQENKQKLDQQQQQQQQQQQYQQLPTSQQNQQQQFLPQQTQQLFQQPPQQQLLPQNQQPYFPQGQQPYFDNTQSPFYGQQEIRQRRALDVKFAFAVFIDGADFNSILETFVGGEQSSMCWLKDLKAVVVVSSEPGKLTKGESSEEEMEPADGEEEAKAKTLSTSKSPEVPKKGINPTAVKLPKLFSHLNRQLNLPNTVPNIVPQNKKEYMNYIRQQTRTKRVQIPITKTASRIKRMPKQKRSQPRMTRKAAKRDDVEDEEGGDEEGEEVVLSFPTLGDDFEETEFVAGLTFAVVWKVPAERENCMENNLCEWMVDNLGPEFTFTMTGSASSSGFKLTGALSGFAVLTEVPEESQLAFTSLELDIDVPDVGVKIDVTMQYKDKSLGAWLTPLVFKGSIQATPMQITLTLTMGGFIYPTALTQYVAIGETFLELGFIAGGPMPSFAFGATLKLGQLVPDQENEHAIVITGYFGFNPVNAGENWFYGTISNVNIGEICSAFELNCADISPALLESGFPEGITASFANEDKEIDSIGTITAGLSIEGAINILGYVCKFEFSLEEGDFKLDVEMGPINWGEGSIQLSLSEDDEETGPIAQIAILASGESSIHIQGFCSFLSLIKAGVDIIVDKTKMKFTIDGSLIPGILDMVIDVEANYGESENPGFAFAGTLKSNDEFQQKLMEVIMQFFEQIKQLVEATMNRAKAALDYANEKLEDVKTKVDGWNQEIASWRAALEERKSELEKEAAEAPPCDCPKVCMPFIGWNSECYKVFGSWFGCPTKDPCFTMVEDVICYAECVAQKAVSALVRWAKTAVVEINLLVADGATALSSLSKGMLTIGQGLVDAAKDGLDFVNEKIKWGLDKANKFLDEYMANFKLHSLSVPAELTADFSMCVSYDISLTLEDDFKSSGQICLDKDSFMNSLVSVITEGEGMTDGEAGLSSIESMTNEAEGQLKSVDEIKGNLEKEDAKVEDQINEETAKDFQNAPERSYISTLNNWRNIVAEKIPKVSSVPTKEEVTLRPSVPQGPSLSLKAMTADPKLRSVIKNPPWASINTRAMPLGLNATLTSSPSVKRYGMQIFQFGDHLSPCQRMKRALNSYSEIANGLSAHASAIHATRSGVMDARNKERQRLLEVRDKIERKVSRRNMTEEEREHSFFMYHKAVKGLDELRRRSLHALQREDEYALPIFRRQLNAATLRHHGVPLQNFTHKLHQHAKHGWHGLKNVKLNGSAVEQQYAKHAPHPTHPRHQRHDGHVALQEPIKTLAAIHQDVDSLLTDEQAGLTKLSERVDAVKRNIISMKPYVMHC